MRGTYLFLVLGIVIRLAMSTLLSTLYSAQVPSRFSAFIPFFVLSLLVTLSWPPYFTSTFFNPSTFFIPAMPPRLYTSLKCISPTLPPFLLSSFILLRRVFVITFIPLFFPAFLPASLSCHLSPFSYFDSAFSRQSFSLALAILSQLGQRELFDGQLRTTEEDRDQVIHHGYLHPQVGP